MTPIHPHPTPSTHSNPIANSTHVNIIAIPIQSSTTLSSKKSSILPRTETSFAQTELTQRIFRLRRDSKQLLHLLQQAKIFQFIDANESSQLDEEEANSHQFASLPPPPHPPIVPLDRLRRFLDDITTLHHDMSRLDYLVKPFELIDLGALHPFVDVQQLQPTCVPTELDLKPVTRFILQYVTIIPSIISILCHNMPDDAAVGTNDGPSLSFSSLQFALLTLHPPCVSSLFLLIEALFMTGYEPLKSYKGLQDHKQPHRIPSPDPKRMSATNTPKEMDSRGTRQRIYSLFAVVFPFRIFAPLSLTLVDDWLLHLDSQLSCIFRRRKLVKFDRPVIHSEPTHQNRWIQRLKLYLHDLRRLMDESRTIEPINEVDQHIPMRERIAKLLLQDLDAYAQTIANGVLILPESFFQHCTHLLYQVIDTDDGTPSSARSGAPDTFSPSMLALLNRVLSNLCTSYDAYVQRFDEWSSSQATVVLIDTQSTHDDDVGDIDLTSLPRTVEPTNNEDSCHPQTAPFAYYRCFDLLLHIVRCNHHRILPHLDANTRFAILQHFPDLFDESWCQLIESLLDDYARLEDGVRKMDMLHRRLAEWWGITRDNNNESHSSNAHELSSSPSNASAFSYATSPFITFGLFESRTIAFTKQAPLQLPSSDSIRHTIPIELYSGAICIARRLYLDSSAPVCLDILHWLHSAQIHAFHCAGATSRRVDLYPSNLSSVISAVVPLNGLSSTSFHLPSAPTVIIATISQHIQSLMNEIKLASNQLEYGQSASNYNHMDTGDGEMKADEAAKMAEICCAVESKREDTWFFLQSIRQWIDYATFVYNQPVTILNENHSAIIDDAIAIISFSLVPLRTPIFSSYALCASIRGHLLGVREIASTLPPITAMSTPSFYTDSEATLIPFIDDMSQACQTMPVDTRMRLWFIIVPSVSTHIRKEAIETIHQRFISDQPLLLCHALTRFAHSWMCGAIIATLIACESIDESTISPTSLPAPSFQPAIQLFLFVHTILRRYGPVAVGSSPQMATSGVNTSPSTSASSSSPSYAAGLKTLIRHLHRQLSTIHEVATSTTQQPRRE